METAARSGWADHARAVLDECGHRRGGARDAVIDLLARQRCALSAIEIEDRLREENRRVSRASVYRVLDLLQGRGLVTRVEVGDAVARFEAVDPAGHHHHLV